MRYKIVQTGKADIELNNRNSAVDLFNSLEGRKSAFVANKGYRLPEWIRLNWTNPKKHKRSRK